MAKIHKISGYLVDPNDEYGNDVLRNCLEYSFDSMFQQLHIETADIGEWNDDNPLNYPNCDLADCEKYFPKEPTKSMQERQVKGGEIYRHFKGQLVMVIVVAQDTENVGSYSVVYYKVGDGRIWCRPYDMFISEVDHEKYPEATQMYRFEKIN